MTIPVYILLACSTAWAQAPTGTPRSTAKPAPAVSTPVSTPDAQSASDLNQQLDTTSAKSAADLSRLRIDKWKLDAAGKQQAQSISDSIRRNLTDSMPELLVRLQASPASLNANFRLYRNLDTLCYTFSSFVESAETFSPREQYDPLAADFAQLNLLRRQVGDRVDLLAGANDAELARLRALVATPSGTKPAVNKVVVNDNDQSKPKKKSKTAQTPPKPAQ